MTFQRNDTPAPPASAALTDDDIAFLMWRTLDGDAIRDRWHSVWKADCGHLLGFCLEFARAVRAAAPGAYMPGADFEMDFKIGDAKRAMKK